MVKLSLLAILFVTQSCSIISSWSKNSDKDVIVPNTGYNWPSHTDWVELVRNWVEKGVAPERVVLSKTEDEEVVMTRPVFPYPKKTIYDGKGDPNKESSYR